MACASGLGFTHDSASTEEFLGTLGRIETFEPLSPETAREARSYAYAFFVRHPWLVRSFEFTFDFPERGWHPLDRNLTVTARSEGDLHRQGDLDEWARWVLDTRDQDFLATQRPRAGQPA